MTASRQQHTAAATLILAAALVVAWISFTQEPAEAFLFPRLISVFFAGLAVWNFVRAVTGMARVGVGLAPTIVRNLLPGLAAMLVLVFAAAKGLGFYLGAALAFLVIYTLYDPTDMRNAAGWVKRTIVTLVFMAVVYGLFALLLKVQTPRGLVF